MNRYYKKPAELNQGVKTGHSHPGCYLASTENCCTTISGEHLISQNLMKRASKGRKVIQIGGHKWLHGQKKDLAISGLVANVLCKRHNSMLSPLDEAAGVFFDLTYGRLVEGNADPFGILVSGHDLERWAVQRFLAHDYGNSLYLKGETIHASEEMRALARAALLDDAWGERCGFYLSHTPADLASPIENAPILMMPSGDVIGMRITLASQAFVVVWHYPENSSDVLMPALRDYRPRLTTMRAFGRSIHTMISWRDGTVVGVPGGGLATVGRAGRGHPLAVS